MTSLLNPNPNLSLGPGVQPYMAPPVEDPMLALIRQRMAQPRQNAAMPNLSALINPPARHLDMSGNVINPETGVAPGNPFDNGFFRSAADRAQIERQRLTVNPSAPINGITGAGLDERQAAMQQTQGQVAGVPGMLPVGALGRTVADPFNMSGMPLPGVDLGNLVAPGNALPWAQANVTPGLHQGQINPNLPPGTATRPGPRYQNSNYWSALIPRP